jgi:hypothetical protein
MLKKTLKKVYLGCREVPATWFADSSKIQNIYHASIQKTGSQWIKTIFKDKRIQKYTGLAVYPQHRYEWGEFHRRFPKYTFVPGLYIPYSLYEEIEKPKKYKTIYIVRDPRNIIVSWYYSMLKTHVIIGKVLKHRLQLQSLSFEEGINYCIKAQQLQLAFVRDWIQNQEDPNLLIVKFEDLISYPEAHYKSIFNYCNIDIPDFILESVIADYTKEKMREKDLNKRLDNSESHYKKQNSDWREVFTKNHEDLFYQITGNLIDILGYKR